jgi:predicted methyltransferase
MRDHLLMPSARITDQAQQAVARFLRPGEIAIDATAGNGHDTLFLARIVGETGRVYACDVQSEAIESTAERLRAAGIGNVTLVQGDHARLEQLIPAGCRGRVGAVMFNLGYRPGGNKTIATELASTVRAVETALTLLRPGGVLSVVGYVGHPGGREETLAVECLLDGLDPERFETLHRPDETATSLQPRLYVVSVRSQE